MILEHGVVLGAQEEDDGVATFLLALRDGLDAVHARVEPVARHEAQHVPHVDDGVPRPRLDVVPAARQQHLQPPLLAEQDRQAARVGVFVQAEPFGVGVLLRVPQQAQERFGRLAFSVQFFEPSARLQAQSVRQVFQDRRDDHVRLRDKAFEQTEVFLDDNGEVRIRRYYLLSGYLSSSAPEPQQKPFWVHTFKVSRASTWFSFAPVSTPMRLYLDLLALTFRCDCHTLCKHTHMCRCCGRPVS